MDFIYKRGIEPSMSTRYLRRRGVLYQSNVGCFYKVQYVLCRYTVALLPRISAPWTASSHYSTVDSVISTFQHHGQHHVHISAPWTAPGHSLQPDAELLLNHTKLPSSLLKTPQYMCTAVTLWWVNGCVDQHTNELNAIRLPHRTLQ